MKYARNWEPDQTTLVQMYTSVLEKCIAISMKEHIDRAVTRMMCYQRKS